MPQEKGWYLHGGDIHELWAKVDRRVEELLGEAGGLPEPGAAPAPEGPERASTA